MVAPAAFAAELVDVAPGVSPDMLPIVKNLAARDHPRAPVCSSTAPSLCDRDEHHHIPVSTYDEPTG